MSKGMKIPDGTTVYIPAVRVKDDKGDNVHTRFSLS